MFSLQGVQEKVIFFFLLLLVLLVTFLSLFLPFPFSLSLPLASRASIEVSSSLRQKVYLESHKQIKHKFRDTTSLTTSSPPFFSSFFLPFSPQHHLHRHATTNSPKIYGSSCYVESADDYSQHDEKGGERSIDKVIYKNGKEKGKKKNDYQ